LPPLVRPGTLNHFEVSEALPGQVERIRGRPFSQAAAGLFSAGLKLALGGDSGFATGASADICRLVPEFFRRRSDNFELSVLLTGHDLLSSQ
jgi:hypothetical protein